MWAQRFRPYQQQNNFQHVPPTTHLHPQVNADSDRVPVRQHRSAYNPAPIDPVCRPSTPAAASWSNRNQPKTPENAALLRAPVLRMPLRQLQPSVGTINNRQPADVNNNLAVATTSTVNDSTTLNKGESTSQFRIYGSSDREKVFILTGTVDRVIKWSKLFKNQMCYYEVIAPVVSIQTGTIHGQKIMLLRDKKGPILQVSYYATTYIDVPDFSIGQTLACLGRMCGPNMLHALSIRSASVEEEECLDRLSLLSEQAVELYLAS